MEPPRAHTINHRALSPNPLTFSDPERVKNLRCIGRCSLVKRGQNSYSRGSDLHLSLEYGVGEDTGDDQLPSCAWGM